MSAEQALPGDVTAALREVLEPSGMGPAPRSGNDIVDALVLAAHATGTHVRPERIAQVARQPSPTVVECAQRLGVPVREVTLQGEWWQAESGPYVVLDAAGQGAAAIPRGSRYLLVRGGVARPLDRPGADELAETAWTVTARLTERPVGLSDVWEVAGTGGRCGAVSLVH